MAPGGGEEQVRARPEFTLTWRGFHRGQVTEFVEYAEAELHRITAERDAAARRAAALAQENRELRAKIDRISRTPIAADALQERTRRMIELTREEAVEITARATEKAEQTRLDAEREAVRLTAKEKELVAAAEAEAVRQRAEHEESLRLAEERRRELDEAAAHRRAQLEEDLTRAMTIRRAEALHVQAEEDKAARAKADRLIAKATERAASMITAAESEVSALNEVRDQLLRSMTGVRALLAEASGHLEPGVSLTTVSLEDLPSPRRAPSDDLTDVGG